MKLEAVVTVPDEEGLVYKLFTAEDKEIGQRASFRVVREGSACKFFVVADDAVALRAALNSITKVLSVHEQSGRAVHVGE
ncbi:hypothetical protein D6783_03270 [Candidatus Woesearchaeota archaeon]|nr:MAG: hypothetical protein D6783_03270 [Candidatus Woesearchaeota archaeon]